VATGSAEDAGQDERDDQDDQDEAATRRLRNDSDGFLDAIRELHELEERKRTQEISSPEFHEIAREITERSRDIFRRAAVQQRDGATVSAPQGTTVDEVSPADARPEETPADDPRHGP
jgi:hypothetical protein